MEIFLPILYASLLIESVVNIINNIREKETSWKYWGALGLAIAGSVLVTYNWNIDVFSVLLGEGRIPFVGAVLTGLIISRGANIVSDVVGALTAVKASG